MAKPSRFNVWTCLTALLLFVAATLGDPVPRASGQDRADVLRLAHEHLQIGLDRRDGALRELVDVATKHNHVGEVGDSGGLWELSVRRDGQSFVLKPSQARSFRAEPLPGQPHALRLLWDSFGLADGAWKVEATVRLDPGQPMSRWTIAVERPAGAVLAEVRFPRVLAIARQECERLAVPVWMGEQLTDPRRRLAGQRLAWSYPGPLSMQCLAYYRDQGPGLYAACDDTAALQKSFAVWGDGKSRVHLEVIHYPENDVRPAGRCTLGYHVLLGTFHGDWFTAAERYRAWGLQQDWARRSRLRQGLVPDWVTATGVWVWNRGRSPGVLPPAVALRERLGLPVSVFWHWWHGCAYDAGFPEYFPPREGSEAFRAALSQAQGRGVRAIVYMNQRLWGMTTKSWHDEQAARYAVKGVNGKIAAEVYNIFTQQPCAPMCMGTPFWRRKYAGLAEKAFGELAVDGIYMDQACLSLACYDPSHGHTPGGGNFWTQGFRALVDDLRSRGPRNAVLAGEGCGETWLPYLDLMLSLQVSKERYAGWRDGWDVIPLFHAIYHPLAVTYGNYSSLTLPPYDDLWPPQFAPKQPLALLDRKFSRQFRVEQARAFVWGQQPTIANFLPSQFEQRREEIDYFMRLARVRSRAIPYLLQGTMLRPPRLEIPEMPVDFSRLSIYAGQRSGVASPPRPYPAALAGAWQSPNGTVAIALASIAEQELRVSLALDAREYGLPPRGRLHRIDEAGRQPMGEFSGSRPTAEVNLPACGACVIEFAPKE